MAKPVFPYLTFTGLTLDVKEDEGEWVVTLTGTTEKEVVRGDEAFCREVAERERQHYIAREKAEVDA